MILTAFFIFLILTILSIVFLPNIDFYNPRYDIQTKSDTKGLVLSVSETNNSVNGKRALKYDFEFFIDNEIIKGQSYGFEDSTTAVDTVDIEYLLNCSITINHITAIYYQEFA